MLVRRMNGIHSSIMSCGFLIVNTGERPWMLDSRKETWVEMPEHKT